MRRRPATLRAALALCSVAAVTAGTGALAAGAPAPDPTTPARTVPFALVEDREVADRLPRPEDRYAVAGGCYTLEAPGAGFVARTDGGLVLTGDAASALPLHFQATRLGEYLLATDEGRDTAYEGAWWDVRGYLAGTSGALPLPVPVGGGDGVVVADAPSEDAEWRVVAAGDDPEAKVRGAKAAGYLFTVPSRDEVLVAEGGALRLAPAASAEPTPLRLAHVRDDDPTDDDANGTACASWPEVETGASGEPEPVATSAASRARGFFEAHVHGMAFEAFGGELRCGRPWHPYGVEYALGSCDEESNPFNRALEVPLGGQPPDYVVDYDPQGWPTFASWPRNRTLTHEQFYWRWLERAYAGGLRLMTNLLVDNTALCQQFPVKKNSCNEMDGVRLQAQRLFELQDYVDAQNGGPGEGWFRIVTSPAQARQIINDGRLAVVLGIEISALFDCSELLDQPQCTTEQIDERLQEVLDMGVRQMELVNKFDNALTGVKGDSGTSGPVVNVGNKYVTGHFWDMRTCAPEEDPHAHGSDRVYEGDEHDHTQISPTDATPEQAEGVDALAGRVLDQFGPVVRTAAPLYGAGPHCNSRGLTDLGRYLIRAMVEKGMMFDPDHMSASAQRAALDLVAEIRADEQAEAAQQGRPARGPSVISSHSWGNDVTYQRVYELDGVVAPYAGAADSYARAWKQLRAWAAQQTTPGRYDFGMGYGADTNGLGGQPPPRTDPAQPLQYTPEGFEAPIGGVRLTQHTSGLRTFDVTTEGVAMYGLFADWFQEAKLAADELVPELGGGAALEDDMLDGAETYLQMWERSVYGGRDCVDDQSMLQVEDLQALLGGNLEGFLRSAGAPVDRDGAAYVYCVEGAGGSPEVVEVVFDETGTPVDVVPSTRDVASAAPAGTGLSPAPDRAATPVGAAAPARAAALPAAQPAAQQAARQAAQPDPHGHDAGAPLDHEHGATFVAAQGESVRTSGSAPWAAGGLVLLGVLALAGSAVVDRRRTTTS